jgi:hypothetical protein
MLTEEQMLEMGRKQQQAMGATDEQVTEFGLRMLYREWLQKMMLQEKETT